jgi:hypothetical protein
MVCALDLTIAMAMTDKVIAADSLTDCERQVITLIQETEVVGARRFEIYDIIVVSGINDRNAKEEGCRMYGRLVPLYSRLRLLIKECKTSQFDFSSDLVRQLDHDESKASNFFSKAHCS